MSNTQVQLDIDGAHAAITFVTEDGLNVSSPDVLHSFGAAVAKVRKDPNVRSTAIQAKGKVFLAGADIKEMANYGPEEAREYGSLGQGVLNDLAALPSITVAAINGAALGGGLEVALACDFRIAVKSAKLGLPEVSLGLIPGWGGITRLTKLVGLTRAKRMFLSAMPVSAEEGISFGLVDELASSGHVAREVIGADKIEEFNTKPDYFERLADRFGMAMGRGIASRVGAVGSIRID